MSFLPSEMERIAAHIANMNRQALERELLDFSGSIKLDFSPEYLNSLSLDRLRHILLVARLQHPLH